MQNYVSMECPKCGAPLHPGGDAIECEYCGTRLYLHHSESAQGPAGQPGAQLDIPTLTEYVGQDDKTGLPAFRLLVPEEWDVGGGVSWVTGRPGAPVQLAIQVAHPTGDAKFEVFPDQYYVWVPNPMALNMPQGSNYMGSEVQPPSEPRDAIMSYLLPRQRGISSAEVISAEADAAWAERLPAPPPLPPQVQLRRKASRIRVRYTQQGRQMMEEIRAAVEYANMPMPTMWGYINATYWNIARAIGYRAPEDQFETLHATFESMAESADTNLQWVSAVRQISQWMVQNGAQHVDQLGGMARSIGQQFGAVSQPMPGTPMGQPGAPPSQESGWQGFLSNVERQIKEAFGMGNAGAGLLGGGKVNLEEAYQQAWMNDEGDYFLSDDPDFDPNQDSANDWTRIFRWNEDE